MNQQFVCAAVGLLATASLTMAGTVIVDFEQDSAGNALSAGTGFAGSEYAADSVSISGTNGNGSPMNLFDSANPTGGDGDLGTGAAFGTSDLGNVLILQDLGDNPISEPDDDETGAKFTFDFSSAGGVDFASIGLLDLDETVDPIFMVTFLGGGTATISADSVNLVNPAFPGNNSLRIYSFDLAPITSFSIELPGVSGAVTGFEFANVPAPAGVAAFVLGTVAALRRRRA